MIIGKLIPAGTGMSRYRDIATHAPDYEPLPFYSSDTDADGDLDLAAWLADTSATTLDEDVAAFAAVASVPEAGRGAVTDAEIVEIVEAVVADVDSAPVVEAFTIEAVGSDGSTDADDLGDAAL